MNQKPLFLAAVLVALIVIAGAFWYLKPFPTVVNQPDVVTESPIPTLPRIEPENLIDTADWKTYRNDRLKFSVGYPDTFRIDTTSTDTGHIVSFLEYNENAKNLDGQNIPGYFPVISIYQWEDINSPDLKGGSWEGEKTYKNLQDFFADSEHTHISVTGETSVDGVKAYAWSNRLRGDYV
jgi:hypothetical protein